VAYKIGLLLGVLLVVVLIFIFIWRKHHPKEETPEQVFDFRSMLIRKCGVPLDIFQPDRNVWPVELVMEQMVGSPLWQGIESGSIGWSYHRYGRKGEAVTIGSQLVLIFHNKTFVDYTVSDKRDIMTNEETLIAELIFRSVHTLRLIRQGGRIS
jgi:hypothetical protein